MGARIKGLADCDLRHERVGASDPLLPAVRSADQGPLPETFGHRRRRIGDSSSVKADQVLRPEGMSPVPFHPLPRGGRLGNPAILLN